MEVVNRTPSTGSGILAEALERRQQPIKVTSREELKQLIKEQTGDFVISIFLEPGVPDER